MRAFRRTLRRTLLIPFAVVLGSATARAEGAISPQIGLLAGAAIVNSVSSFTYGFTAGIRYGTNWNAGIYFSSVGLGVPAGFLSGYAVSSGVTSLLAEGNYVFTNIVPNFYAGIKMGLVFSNSSLSSPSVSVNSSNSNFAYGGTLGYGFALSDKITMGPELNLTSVVATGVLLGNLVAVGRFRF